MLCKLTLEQICTMTESQMCIRDRDAAFKHHVLDDGHLRTDLGFRTLVPDKADACAGKIVFRILAEQQHLSLIHI